MVVAINVEFRSTAAGAQNVVAAARSSTIELINDNIFRVEHTRSHVRNFIIGKMGGDYDMKVATRIVGFVSGILTIVLGFIHIINVKAHIEWPSHFIDDVNRLHWRILFTFQPGVIGAHSQYMN